MAEKVIIERAIEIMENRVYPGINKQANFQGLPDEEMTIVNKISNEWYVTKALGSFQKHLFKRQK